MLKTTRTQDPEVYEIVVEELNRQVYNIEMIASESTVPTPVLELSGCVFTNKTEEGLPGKRFQAGSEQADRIENLAIQRALEVYGADYVNLQPYSGSTANYAAFNAVLKPGDKVMSMRLDQGGHLTHGSPANFLSKIYQHQFYGVDKTTERIDYNILEEKALKFKPKMIISGASAYPRLIDYKRIAEIAKACGAVHLNDMAHIAGLVGAKVIPSPIPYCDFVTSSTTKTFCGPRAGLVFCKEKYKDALNNAVFPGTLGSIHLHTIAAKAFSFKYMTTPEFKETMERILRNSKLLAKELAANNFRIVSGGSDNHIVLVDLKPKGITGREMEKALEYVGITVNKNQIPFDDTSPTVCSGIRIGMTSTAQRGLEGDAIKEIAEIINKVSKNPADIKNLDACKMQAHALISKYPLYPADYFED